MTISGTLSVILCWTVPTSIEKQRVNRKVPVICRKSVQALMRQTNMISCGASARTGFFSKTLQFCDRLIRTSIHHQYYNRSERGLLSSVAGHESCTNDAHLG